MPLPPPTEISRDFFAKPSDLDQSLKLFRHRVDAIQVAIPNEIPVVAMRTGSGKSPCFFIPIVDAILKAKESDTASRIWAIDIDPMNALANSQMLELTRFLGHTLPSRSTNLPSVREAN